TSGACASRSSSSCTRTASRSRRTSPSSRSPSSIRCPAIRAMESAELDFIIPLSSPEAADADRFGPKAANLARLAHAGLPTPRGFCIDATAYRPQLKSFGLDSGGATRHEVLALKLAFFDRPIVEALRAPLLDAWRRHSAHAPAGMAVRSSALVEDRF